MSPRHASECEFRAPNIERSQSCLRTTRLTPSVHARVNSAHVGPRAEIHPVANCPLMLRSLLENLRISNGNCSPRPRYRLTQPVFPVLPAKSPSNRRRFRLYVLYNPIDWVARSREILLGDLSAPLFAMLVSNRIVCFNLIGRGKARAISQTNRVQLSQYHFNGLETTRQ